jgi:hypothetical protein
MPSPPKLETADDYGGQRQIGFKRTDALLFHTIVRAPGGSVFAAATVKAHFETCEVCKAHGVTYDAFKAYMRASTQKMQVQGSEAAVDEDTVEGTCPFCGVKMRCNWKAGHIDHAVPMCKTFKKLTADEFVQAVLDGKHKN